MLKVGLCGAVTHPVYADLIEYPPRGYSYIVEKPSKQLGWLKERFDFPFLRKLYYEYGDIFRPKRIKPEIELVHVCDSIISAEENWVVDFEHVHAILGLPPKKWDFPPYKKTIERRLSAPNCKKIMAWSVAAEKSALNLLNTSGFKDKLEVVYPAIRSINVKRKKEHNGTNLLFVGRNFFAKGGKELLAAFDLLNKKYDIKLTVVSAVPREYRAKYAGLSNLELIQPMPRERLAKLYRNADVFVLPTMGDTFGYVFLEAMNFCLPIVTLNIFSAVREIIKDGKNGFLIEPKLSMFNSKYLMRYGRGEGLIKIIKKTEQPRVVRGLVEKLSILIEDKSLRRKMGERGKKEVEKGKFSINERNKKLEEIYEDALKK